MDDLRFCMLCPRCCGAERLAGKRGFCGETAELRIASASIHRGEEPPLCGRGGSGTVFVSGCTLGCVFCQNYQISQKGMGRPISQDELVAIFFALKQRGAENINIVTGSHAPLLLREGIAAAREAGLDLPVLWNSSAYENPKTLFSLRGAVDVWLPDLKTLDTDLAARFFKAPDYPDAAAKAILAMLDMQGSLEYSDGLLQKGVIIRHLVLPGYLESSEKVIRWFAGHAQGRALLSVMTQYTPLAGDAGAAGEAAAKTAGTAVKTAEAAREAVRGRDRTGLENAAFGGAPGRFVNEREYKTVLGWLDSYGIEDGFYQELVQDSAWCPDFNKTNPFSSELSVPVWHWKSGFVQGYS
ncbi:MAG: radical SAM protein [Spirochaetaceae bacterium]|jgi:putative pyruvate formate lyase activating enzyme|nr:radical SAM protein [Spirochaetaceae bacterium]